MNFNLLDNFPKGFEPNEAQNLILSELGDALEKGKKFIIINAPTATGKSFISKTIANYSDEPSNDFVQMAKLYELFDSKCEFEYDKFGCAILTVTKQLQEQYLHMFSDGKSLKGCANYICDNDPRHGCDFGPCKISKDIFDNCMCEEKCPYWNAMRDVVCAKCQFYSYAMFNTLKPIAKHRQFIICDEASELENTYVNMFTYEFIFKNIKKVFNGTDYTIPPTPDWKSSEKYYFEWAKEVYRYVTLIYNEQISKLAKAKKDKNKIKLTKVELDKISIVEKTYLDFKNLIENWNLTKYIVECKDSSITFIPFNIDTLIQNYLFSYGDTIILMSATIVDHPNFAKTLGINDYVYIEAPSQLPPEKAPIHFSQKFYLNYSNIKYIMPTLTTAVEELCKKHKGQKGIIHTHSMQILNLLKDNLTDTSRFLFREHGISNEDILTKHIESDEDTILVSPSMTHGVDLKGELGEFQIIIKAPYLPMKNLRIDMKKDIDTDWYINQMLSTLIQMSGRCNRCESDYSETYVLDGCITAAVIKYANRLPQYFKNRIV